MRKIAFIFVFIFVCLNIYAEKAKLAVMEISDENKILNANELENATEYLRGKLASSGKYVVIAKERQQKEKTKMMREESYKQCYDKNCQIPLGQSLAADTIFTGKITMLLGRYTLTVEIIDLAKEATIQAASFDFNKKEEFLDILDKVIEKIVHGSDKSTDKTRTASVEYSFNVKKGVVELGEINTKFETGRFQASNLIPGKYQLIINAEGSKYQPFVTDVDIVSGINVQKFKVLRKPVKWYKSWWFWTITSVVVVGTAAGVTAAVLTSSAKSQNTVTVE